MATGDQADFVGRLRALLPSRWFPSPGATASVSPTLDGVLNGFASAWASLYALLTYAGQQTRLATATGIFLDLFAGDYFGLGLQRLMNEQDGAYRARIGARLLAPKGTRAAMIAALTALTGEAPTIFEPARPADCGGYGNGSLVWTGLAYDMAGGYGELDLTAQCFITVHRPAVPGIPNAAGYGTLTGNSVSSPLGGYGGGGWGTGVTAAAISPSIEYASLSENTGAFEDALIYATVAATQQAGTICWTKVVA